MKLRIFCLFILLIMAVFVLSGCEQNDDMMFESFFPDIGRAFVWFFDTLTPSFFGALSSAWAINSFVGTILASIMSVLMVIVYAVLAVAFIFISLVLAAIALIATIIGYIIFILAAVFKFFFKTA